MQKIEEIKKTLEFYVLANKLKTTLVEENDNYSVADDIFGRMILAIAMDSEFKETDNIGKLLRMMFLEEFAKLNPNYPIYDILKKGEQYKEEIDEVRFSQTNESRLIYKYKILDYYLTQLINKKGNILNYPDLVNEGIKILNSKNPDEYSKYSEIFHFYFLNSKLKHKVRSGWDDKHWNINSERIERISEHIIGTIALAIVMDSEFDYSKKDNLDRNIDIDEIIKLLAIHEAGETLIGDITPFDGITPNEKKEIEHKAMKDVIGNLSDKNKLLDLLFEFDEHSSKESIFAYFCDKIEADLQSKIYQDSGLQNSLEDQNNNCVFKSPKVQQMIKDGAQTAFDIWYNWDINIFKDNDIFPEFANLINVTKDNNLFTLNNDIIMQKIELSKQDHKFLINVLEKMLKILTNYDTVECVYLTNYQSQENNKGTIDVMVLVNDFARKKSYKSIIRKINNKFLEINKTDVLVNFDFDYVSEYSIDATTSNEVYKIERLIESSIIFDKSGRITELREEMKKYIHLYPFYLVEYRPPVDKALILKLKSDKFC